MPAVMSRFSLNAVVAVLLCQSVVAFQPSRPQFHAATPWRGRELASLLAKKGRGGGGGGGGSNNKGFGKLDVTETVTAKSDAAPSSRPSNEQQQSNKGAFLQSVEQGGTAAKPELAATTAESSNLPPEERTKQILREKYGMKTLEEQQMKDKQMQQLKAQQKKLAELKKKAELDQDIDIIAMIPAPVLKALDAFLKGGVVLSGTAFIVAGILITAEAWSKASGQALPPDMDNFIVNVVEPNFTPGLLVVLGFSVSLGVLAAASLGSEGAQYRQKD
mmetsp:Transcript_7601/g.14429  ORF Transcript_7601/g.14429 Transcript_7601/m.14429 type:complete len:275 (+) Transcript_7601:196-1020(+)|eukprot:scaffold8005_cov275-Amphora_coffeaeformis.AAC.33